MYMLIHWFGVVATGWLLHWRIAEEQRYMMVQKLFHHEGTVHTATRQADLNTSKLFWCTQVKYNENFRVLN
jgi:hypothetical protein